MRYDAEHLDTVNVNVEYFDGSEEGDVDYPYYVADCVEIVGVTDGKTLEALTTNVRDMIRGVWQAVYEGQPYPEVFIHYKLPELV